MAKAKEITKELDGLPERKDKAILESLKKQFGADIFVSASYVCQKKRTIIPWSPQFDIGLNGGVREGSFIVTTGPPKIGKSSSSLDFAASFLDTPSELYGDRHVYFFDIEGRLNPRDLNGIKGLQKYAEGGPLSHRFTVIKSVPGKIIAGEEFLSIGESLINAMPGSLFIFDSFSQLCSAERRKSEMGKRFRDDIPLFLADFCKRISNVVPINDSIIIGITHIIANQGNGMSPWVEASGQKIQFQLDVKLKAKYEQPWKVGETQIGQNVFWECHASPIGPPMRQWESKLRYGHGLDKEAELAAIAVDLGLIKAAGAWYTILDGDRKFQGLEKLRDALEEDKGLYNAMYAQFRESMGFKNQG